MRGPPALRLARRCAAKGLRPFYPQAFGRGETGRPLQRVSSYAGPLTWCEARQANMFAWPQRRMRRCAELAHEPVPSRKSPKRR
jgi:hypothetical protein